MLKRGKNKVRGLTPRCVIKFIVGALFFSAMLFGCARRRETIEAQQSSPTPAGQPASVELNADQLRTIKIEPVTTYPFSIEKRGIGTIEFDNKVYFDNSLSTQVFPPSEGTIVTSVAELGDYVQKGDPLYVISTTRGAHLTVVSPITGQVAAVNASKGMTVHPSTPPAPYAVADSSMKWMIANTPEADSVSLQLGQPAEIHARTYPNRVFAGTVSKIFPTIDPNTHRVSIRIAIDDANNELRAGMLADAVIRTKNPLQSPALPDAGIVREADGTTTAWVTTDRRHFFQRVVKTGLHQDGRLQIVDGLNPGELAVTDGAIFLDNMLQAPPSD